jgi:aryl-alcohol dehydrogenase-like predicted oxidoreductase
MEELVLGTLAFRALPERKCYAILDCFFDHGGKWIDTASLYGHGEVEARLGRYLKTHAPDARLATKIGHFRTAGYYTEAGKLREAMDASCQRLGRAPDVIFLHEADWRVWWERGAPPLEIFSSVRAVELYEHVEQLREYARPYGALLGMTGNHAEALGAVLSQLPAGLINVLLVAKQYDLLWRTGRHVAEGLRARADVECWLGAPFHQGWLFRLDDLSKQVPLAAPHAARLGSLLARQALSVADVAIPFIRMTQPHARVVLGAASVEEVEKALHAARTRLDEGLIAQLLAQGFEGEPMPGPISL